MDEITRVALEVQSLESQRREAVEVVKKAFAASKKQSHNFLESGLGIRVEEIPVTGRIAAVDGGSLAQEFHSLDLFLCRACAVAFDYENNRVVKSHFHPSAFPAYSITSEHSLELHEFAWASSLERIKAELTCAVETVKKFKPSLMLLDGSIAPQVGDRPARESASYAKYESVLDLFSELYSTCVGAKIALAGVVKDSRGGHFVNLLRDAVPELAQYAKALEKTGDTSLLYHLLAEGERTPAFRYGGVRNEQGALRDIGEWGDKVASFYVKPVAYDRPLRVDFLSPTIEIPNLASVIHSLSRGNRAYAYPHILIEADLRAAMDPTEMDFVKSALFTKLGSAPDLMALRRDSRPFR